MKKIFVLLFIGFFNAAFLSHVFVVLTIQGEYLIREYNPWIAGFEAIFCFIVSMLFIVLMFKIKERN